MTGRLVRLEGIEPRPGAAEDSTTEHRRVSPYGSDENDGNEKALSGLLAYRGRVLFLVS